MRMSPPLPLACRTRNVRLRMRTIFRMAITKSNLMRIVWRLPRKRDNIISGAHKLLSLLPARTVGATPFEGKYGSTARAQGISCFGRSRRHAVACERKAAIVRRYRQCCVEGGRSSIGAVCLPLYEGYH